MPGALGRGLGGVVPPPRRPVHQRELCVCRRRARASRGRHVRQRSLPTSWQNLWVASLPDPSALVEAQQSVVGRLDPAQASAWALRLAVGQRSLFIVFVRPPWAPHTAVGQRPFFFSLHPLSNEHPMCHTKVAVMRVTGRRALLEGNQEWLSRAATIFAWLIG